MAHDSPLPPVDRWGECDTLPEPRSRQRRFSVQAILATVLGLAVLLPLLGSGAGSLQVLRSTPSYGAVAGRVTYHGKPVSALLILHKPHGGPFAVVQCDKEGRYSMPRLALGEATITLVVTTLWASPRENSMIHFDALSNDALLAAGTVARAAPPPGAVSLSSAAVLLVTKDLFVTIPARYGDPETSGLRRTVMPGEQTIDLDLSD